MHNNRTIWQEFNQYIYDTPILSGQLKIDQCTDELLELYSDKLLKLGECTKLLPINECYLSRMNNQIILYYDDQKIILEGKNILEWQQLMIYLGYEHLKRYCMLPNFQSEHQILSRVKSFECYMFECRKFSNNQNYLVQIIQQQEMVQYQKIIKILRTLNSKSILRLMEVYKYNEQTFVLYEYFKGTPLCQLSPKPTEKQLAIYVYQILNGIKHMQDKFIFHNALNASNILVKDDQIRIINFESASTSMLMDDISGLYRILKNFDNPDFSNSYRDFSIRIPKMKVNQALYHQWFINRHVRYRQDGPSLMTIIEKTDSFMSNMNSTLHNRRTEEYTDPIEQEEPMLFQQYQNLTNNYLIPSKLRRE